MTRLVMIIDNGVIAPWHVAAVEKLEGLASLTVFNCTNSVSSRSAVKHGLYYLLNMVSIKNMWTRKVPLSSTALNVTEVIDFESEREGAWQRLPPSIIERINGLAPHAVLKFGMLLLRVPEQLKPPILSFHHGDPEHYRGRPPGFYETLNGEGYMGQIVQILTNRLDAGPVVAYGETKVYPYSYRATMKEAYGHSPLLLPQALANAVAGRSIEKNPVGRNYRLPSNRTVVRFTLAMVFRFLLRLLYGAFIEKKWEVSTAHAPESWDHALRSGDGFPDHRGWNTVTRLKRYSFYADPFFSKTPPGLLIEALNGRTGKGEILLVGEDGEQRPLSDPARHFSYPFPIEEDGRHYVVPEIAHWSAPRIYAVDADGMHEVAMLDVAGGPAISDPSFHWHEGRLYLFGNDKVVGPGALYLWSAPSLFGRFEPHPISPLLVSPRGARMGGALLQAEGRLIRFGQNFLRGYGDGLFGFEVERLSPDEYIERPIGELRFSPLKGPHTIHSDGRRVVFDSYSERFSPFAGVRRFLGGRRLS
jgi:hypothetical protein